MEVAEHYGTNNNDSSDENPESMSEYNDGQSPLSTVKKSLNHPNDMVSNMQSIAVTSASSEFAAAAAAAAAALASEDFRSHSIAALRARAQQHSALLQPQGSSLMGSTGQITDWNTSSGK